MFFVQYVCRILKDATIRVFVYKNLLQFIMTFMVRVPCTRAGQAARWFLQHPYLLI